MTAYVGIDLHRRRSLAVCVDEAGERLWWRRFDNSPQSMAEVVAAAGPDPEVVLEATWGWYWAADLDDAFSSDSGSDSRQIGAAGVVTLPMK